MLVLALAIIPVLLLPLALDLGDTAESFLFGAEWFIWAAFAVELAVKTTLRPRGWCTCVDTGST